MSTVADFHYLELETSDLIITDLLEKNMIVLTVTIILFEGLWYFLFPWDTGEIC